MSNRIVGVIETAIDVEDLDVAVAFYRRLFDFETLALDERFCAFNVGGRSVLLLFEKGGRLAPLVVPGGVIPPHGGDGSAHFAFSITAEDLPKWEERLASQGVAIEGRVHWERGGQSIYFRDPDGHLVELATPGIWAIY
ncbi:MAG TPA: VOC family protein [Pirellulales bacterium]|nr:VOC family protein [Pirellulales bacterium]